MQQAPPAKDVLLLVHDVETPNSERDLDLELADADIAMDPVTGSFATHPKHESACSAQIFRFAFPSHLIMISGLCVLHGWMAIMAAPSVMVFWALAALCSVFSLVLRVLVHKMHDVEVAQRIGAWGWTGLMLQDCIFAVIGYAATPYQDACNVSRTNYVQGSVVNILSAVALALTNGTHGMSFGHKSALVCIMLASALVVVVVCGKDELVLMLCEMASLVVGYAIAHMAELFVRHSYALRVMETRRMKKEKRWLEERNEQLKAEKERLLYDVQRPGRPLADDDRSAIGRGLQAKTGQLYPASDASWSEPGASSESAPPSFPPGPPSSASAHSLPLSWADCGTEADRQQWIAAKWVTDQKVAPPLAEIGHRSSACLIASSVICTAAPATKRKATHIGKLIGGKPVRRMTKAGLKHNRFLLKVAPLTWAEADRQHYAAMASQLVTDQKVDAVLADHRAGNARAARSAEAPAKALPAPSTPPVKTETVSMQTRAAAVALAAMAMPMPSGARALV